jgi:transcriptional regulator with XRE-family HTH domain
MARAQKIGDNGKALGARIQAARQAARIPGTELAAIIGVTEGALRQIESGEVKTPSATVLLRIARELHVDPNELAFGPLSPREPPDVSALTHAAAVESFGERLRRLRSERGITVVDLAAAVGAAEGTIRQIENGSVKMPNMLLGIRIAEMLGVDPYALALGGASATAERLEDHDRRLRAIEARLSALERRV